MSNEELILFERSGAVARITFNRPDRLNSFSAAMSVRFIQLLDEVAADRSVRALIVTGAGRGFCAGQDLTERQIAPGDGPPDLSLTIDRIYNPIIRKIRALRLPVIAAVNGTAAGAGANIALACDIVIAARSAKFIQAFCRIGLMPDSGGTWLLPRLVGGARAAGLAMLGEPLSAEQAAEWGLIWKVVDDTAFVDEIERLGAHLAAQPTRALAAIKAALHASWSNDLGGQLDIEREQQRALGFSDDYREGVNAFLAKRAPQYRGS